MNKWLTKKVIAAALLILLGLGIATGESATVRNAFDQVVEYVQSYLDETAPTE